MPLQFNYDANDICELRISGVLKRDEFAAAQAELARKIDAGAKPRVPGHRRKLCGLGARRRLE